MKSQGRQADDQAELLPGVGLENPMLRSGLALAGANWKSKGFTPVAGAEDGILNAEDVSGMDLLATDLGVLSACETGLGAIHKGEGVFGLRRAFVLAGAKTLVMSLWKVPDEITQKLMVEFYRRIQATTLVNRPSRPRHKRPGVQADLPRWEVAAASGHVSPLLVRARCRTYDGRRFLIAWNLGCELQSVEPAGLT